MCVRPLMRQTERTLLCGHKRDRPEEQAGRDALGCSEEDEDVDDERVGEKQLCFGISESSPTDASKRTQNQSLPPTLDQTQHLMPRS